MFLGNESLGVRYPSMKCIGHACRGQPLPTRTLTLASPLNLSANSAHELIPPTGVKVVTKDDHDALWPLRRELEGLRSTSVRDWIRRFVKRSFDLAACLLLLAVVLPVGLLVALAIKLDSPGPVFYRAERVGPRGRRMRMLKFRKMHDKARGPALTTDDDRRFTRVGAWLARHKLDELPQLWNVLRGDMSLIGPRPEDPRFVALHVEDFREVLRVRPGVTGLSQLAFAEESRILDDVDPMGHYLERILPQKLALDRMYATKYHLRVDLSILAWTVVAVLMRRDVAVHRETGRMNVRRRRSRSVLPQPMADAPVALATVSVHPALAAAVATDDSEGIERAAG